MQRSSNPKQTRRNKQKHKKVHVLGSKVVAENWDKKQTLDQKHFLLPKSVNFSYRRLGLSARPLTIYTSGGVEKVGTKAPVPEKAVKSFKTPRSEGKIQRNPDGTTIIIYPDSDEEIVPVQPNLAEETSVVKGTRTLILIDNRAVGNCI